MNTAPKPLTIMFWPESAYGPTNQCIGLAAILRDRGHTIVFAAESSWAGKLAPFGFIEELVDLAEPAEGASARAPRLIEPPTFSAFGCAYNAPSPADPSHSVATATQVQPAFARIMPSSPNLRLMQDC